jgi:hypothetical protein
MLASVPVFFSSLIRRIHKVRAIEEERARVAAMQELTTARSAFLAKVSHELRSPLQSIVSALDVIEMRHVRAFEDDGELIARMRRSSLLLNTQLRDLLTLAKGEAAHLELRPEPFEALALVEALADGVRELALAKGLELVIEVPRDAIFVVADGARIDQVLANLAVNSIGIPTLGRFALRCTNTTPRPGDCVSRLPTPGRAFRRPSCRRSSPPTSSPPVSSAAAKARGSGWPSCASSSTTSVRRLQ